MPANICSTFAIVLEQTLNNSAATVGNVRALKVVSVLITGDSGGSISFTNGTTGNTVATGTIGAESTRELGVGTATTVFLATDDLVFTEASGSNVDRIVVICEASAPQTLTVT
jgi:hypothetical protein